MAAATFVDQPRGMGTFSDNRAESSGWSTPSAEATCTWPTPSVTMRFLRDRPRYEVAMSPYYTACTPPCKGGVLTYSEALAGGDREGFSSGRTARLYCGGGAVSTGDDSLRGG